MDASTCNHPSNQQAACFLKKLETMNSESRRVFLAIYHMAPKPGATGSKSKITGQHVRLAMMESLTHPDVAYWVRMNLAVRVARKFAQTTGQHAKAERMASVLEEFHVAADAFAQKLPVSLARRLREEQKSQRVRLVPGVSGLSTQSEGVDWRFSAGISDGLPVREIALIQQFKARIIPGLVRSVRKTGSQTA